MKSIHPFIGSALLALRQSLRMILKHLDVSLEVEPAVFRDWPLGVLFRRHVTTNTGAVAKALREKLI